MYNLLDNNYKITKGKENFDYEEVKSLFTDYFKDYDYVLGDYSYGRIRLKGFYDSNNKKVRKLNDIKYLDNYIKDYCSPGARIFLLKKENR
ncbi:MAG TPA: YutD family protein [Candidatus Onthousia faecipullorum]|uniref:YutD family protein n=1 Tax=Candidatus Onthousia faecipullorum TaxID=2840887 RepID=A0A9D1KB90_9FIRM|nr:YutD family protein [Candidatus Onthousia faecipullorum]